jgi:hypothetical protein
MVVIAVSDFLDVLWEIISPVMAGDKPFDCEKQRSGPGSKRVGAVRRWQTTLFR